MMWGWTTKKYQGIILRRDGGGADMLYNQNGSLPNAAVLSLLHPSLRIVIYPTVLSKLVKYAAVVT